MSMSQEGMEIRSGENQELLIMIIKALANYIEKTAESKFVAQPPITMAIVTPPVATEITEDQSDAPVNGNGRRLTSIAANPYTGALHYVYYPSYYPNSWAK